MLHRIASRLGSAKRTLPVRRFTQASYASDTSVPISSPKDDKIALSFCTVDKPGALKEALGLFEKHSVSLTQLSSRPSKLSSTYSFIVDFEGTSDDPRVKSLIRDLKFHCLDVMLIGSKKVPWFPRRREEVDMLAVNVLEGGKGELEADHPGFNDEEYRERRSQIAHFSDIYRLGGEIERIDYTPREIACWDAVFERLHPMAMKHGCSQHVRQLHLMEEHCGYTTGNIPQLQDVSDVLRDSTGFVLRPVAGLLSARDFFYGLAFRVFFCTQYLRHHSRPFYTPEPDLVHELMGHAPLFADPDFADFSQEIGLASIGATDEEITAIARCYWFSVEFGLCMENGERKAYGAGLLSSFGELAYSMGLDPEEKPEIRPWQPENAALQDYPITKYQPIYYLADDFVDAKNKMQSYVNQTFTRPFNVRWNPHSASIEVDRKIEMTSTGPDEE